MHIYRSEYEQNEKIKIFEVHHIYNHVKFNFTYF